MPRDSNGTYSAPAGTTATTGETIASAPYNAFIADLVSDANSARPVSAGGTGAATAIAAHDALNTKGANIASASTINLSTATGARVNVTGTTTISAVTLTEGAVRIARAAAAFTLTASASLIVNGSESVDYTTTAEDLLLFEGYSSSVVRVWVISTTAAAILGLVSIDEDDMSSDSATKLPTQQSVKAYVDGEIAAIPDAITLGTSQAATSGTSKEFTVPSGVKQITVSLIDVSTNGTDPLVLRLGDAGGVEASGYAANSTAFTSSSAAAQGVTTGFQLDSNHTAAQKNSGSVTLTLVDAATNSWSAKGNTGNTDGSSTTMISGSKSLTTELTTLQLTTSGGTNAFDGTGKWNIAYQ